MIDIQTDLLEDRHQSKAKESHERQRHHSLHLYPQSALQ